MGRGGWGRCVGSDTAPTMLADTAASNKHRASKQASRPETGSKFRAASPLNCPRVLDGLRDGPEIKHQRADCQVGFTHAGNLAMNAAPGAHADYVLPLAMAWFGVMHCSRPPCDVRR